VDRNLASYKALSFTTESNRSSMLYEVKRARAMWDPSLAVPGTNRRGGFRCPVGTRYGGQITDRFGRNCGWGVARRLANEISDLGERLENVGDARRDRKLRKRNERMAGRLAGAPGAIERAAGRIGDALDVTGRQGGQRNRVGAEAPRPAGRLERAAGRLAEAVDPDKPNRGGRARRADAPNAPAAPKAPRGRRQVNAEPRPRPAAAQRPRRNLRPSEERRMQREIDNPGAARTDAGAAPAPAARPRPAAPRRPANAGRRQPANNRDTASRQNEGRPARKPTAVPAAREATPAREPSAAPAAREATPARAESTVEQARRQVEEARNPRRRPAGEPMPERDLRRPEAIARSEEARNARSAPADLRMGFDIPDDGLSDAQLRRILDNNMDDEYLRRVQEGIIQNRDVQLPQNMAAWGRGDLVELRANLQVQENALNEARRELREAADAFGNAGDEDREDAARNLIMKNGEVQRVMDTRLAFKRRLGELEGNDAPNAPEPSRAPSAPRQPSAAAPIANRIADNDNVRARTQAEWRQFFEAQNEEGIPERIQRAMNAAQSGNSAADTDFNEKFNGGGDAMMRIRDRDAMVRLYESRMRELDAEVASKRSAYDRANPDSRDSYRMAQRDLILAMAHRDRFAERRTEIDAVLAAPAPEPLNPEMARKAEQRVKDAILNRQEKLALHLNKQYGVGNAPWKEMTLQKRQNLLAQANDRNATPDERREAKQALELWAQAMYSHPDIEGANGKTYRIVATANLSGNEISVSADISVKNADGSYSNVGSSSRRISLNSNTVYNASMGISAEGHKNNGIQTIYNQHAFMYAKAAGFESVGVSAVSDGPYVWGRIGFESRDPIPSGAVGRMGAQLAAFRRGDASSIIKNEEDANIIEYLIEKYTDNPASVRHMDFIYALSNPYRVQAEKRARDTELKNWFVGNMPMNGGVFNLDKNLIKADPRD